MSHFPNCPPPGPLCDRSVISSVDDERLSYLLELADIEEMYCTSGHSCEKCGYQMNEEDTLNVFHNLACLEGNLSRVVKMALVYIAGYVTRNDDIDDSKYYAQEFGDYINYQKFRTV